MYLDYSYNIFEYRSRLAKIRELSTKQINSWDLVTEWTSSAIRETLARFIVKTKNWPSNVIDGDEGFYGSDSLSFWYLTSAD